MVGRKAAARVGVGLLAAVVAATRWAAGRRSSMVMLKMNVVERRKERRKGREGMLVRRLVGRAAAQGRGRDVFPRGQGLVLRGARVPSLPHHLSVALDAAWIQ